MSDDTNTNTTASQASPGQEEVVDLTLNDLASIKSIIDVAQSRGAFKTNEMVAVGTIATKLEKFLELAVKQSQAAQQGQAAPNA